MLQVTPENTFVAYSFESILSGLLAFLLILGLHRRKLGLPKLPLRLLLSSLVLLSVAFLLSSSLHFYGFYYQVGFHGFDPESVAFPIFLLALICMGGVLCSEGPITALPAVIGAFGLIWLGSDILLPLGDWIAGYESLRWLGMAGLIAGMLLVGRSLVSKNRKFYTLIQLILGGFSFSFFLFFLSLWLEEPSFLLWPARHLILVAALVCIARAIEEETQDLFIQFFIRLNITFIFLAGFIILVVAKVQRDEYLGFAEREAADLLEYLRGHVMHFHHLGETGEKVLLHREITGRIVADFGKLEALEAVSIRLNDMELQLRIQADGSIIRDLVTDPPPRRNVVFGPVLEANTLHLSVPIFAVDAVIGWVELQESTAEMNHRIAHQVMTIFSAFTVMVLFSGVLIGIIVAHADSTIRAQYREIESTHRQLLQAAKLAAVGELAGGVAHEINNPLGVILGRADYLSELARRGNQLEYLEDLEVIQRNADRAAGIIDDLLDFARPHALSPQDAPINPVIEEAIQLTSPRLSKLNVVIAPTLGSSRIVSYDRDRILQVIVNLINNAADAVEAGGRIDLISEDQVERNEVAIVVRDDGVGILPGDLDKVFDPFFTTKEKGTGLGLSVSYAIIRNHRGALAVESVPGKGTSFRIGLPFAERKPESS